MTIAFIPQKKITPHKLRSSYGTNLYQETGDIYLVSDALGLPMSIQLTSIMLIYKTAAVALPLLLFD